MRGGQEDERWMQVDEQGIDCSWWLKLVIFVIFWRLRPSGRAIHIRHQSGAPFEIWAVSNTVSTPICSKASWQMTSSAGRLKSVAFTNKIRPSISSITPQISSLTSRDPGNYGSPLPRRITSVECPSLKAATNFTSLSLLPGLKDGTQSRQELHLCPWGSNYIQKDWKLSTNAFRFCGFIA